MSHDTAPLLRNHIKEKLSNGRPVFSMTVRLVRSVDIASIAYTAGFDSVYIDLEHSSFPLDALGQICMACNHLGVTPLVRVPGLDPSLIGRVMDIGAMGVILPGVESGRRGAGRRSCGQTCTTRVRAPSLVQPPNCTTVRCRLHRRSANSTTRRWSSP